MVLQKVQAALLIYIDLHRARQGRIYASEHLLLQDSLGLLTSLRVRVVAGVWKLRARRTRLLLVVVAFGHLLVLGRNGGHTRNQLVPLWLFTD